MEKIIHETFNDFFTGNERKKTKIFLNDTKNDKTFIELHNYENDDYFVFGNDIMFHTFNDFCGIYEIYENENEYRELINVFKNYNMNNENTLILCNNGGDDYYIMINTQYGILLNFTVDLEFNIYHFKNNLIKMFPHDNYEFNPNNPERETNLIMLLLDFILSMFNNDNPFIKSFYDYNENDVKSNLYGRFENMGLNGVII